MKLDRLGDKRAHRSAGSTVLIGAWVRRLERATIPPRPDGSSRAQLRSLIVAAGETLELAAPLAALIYGAGFAWLFLRGLGAGATKA